MTNARLNLELGKAEIELREMASTDFLTGALNRRSFFELSQREYERARRNEQPMVLLIIDIDQFKEFNDAYGHPGGDAMLVAIVATCRANLRASDLFVRWGGEEFATLLPDTDQVGGQQVAEKLRRAVEDLCIPIDTFQAHATISVGGTLWVSRNETWETVERRADSALYQAKQRGRNCVVMG
jgi:diguanylate cyclase (GGDEF)-like protein